LKRSADEDQDAAPDDAADADSGRANQADGPPGAAWRVVHRDIHSSIHT
jgi:hypothetical protein